jgi:allophanate hydrolase
MRAVLYTKTCTKMSFAALSHPAVAATPRGVAAWRKRLALGEDPLPWLAQCRKAAQASQDQGIWIQLPGDGHWQQQLALLAQRLAERPSTEAPRAELLKRYPLLGVPFAVKDNIHIAGVPTTAACPAYAHVPEHTATVVQRLLDAGALWLGKTNLDQFATGLVGTRSPYGRPASVYDAQRISGGSSSGSAVALALGMVAFALGTDTAGSGRIPAGFNALVGMKPTPGRVSTAGVVPACRSIDCVSLFAHGAADAALLLAVVEGADARDAYSDFRPGPAHLPSRARIGVPKAPEFFGDAGYAPAFAAAIERASRLGHPLVELDFSRLHEVAALLYEGPWVAERHSTVQRLLAEQPEALDATVAAVITRAKGISATQTFEAQYRLRALQAELKALWQQVDVLMVPTAPGHPRFAEIDADPLGVNARLGLYTNFVNLLGWCALALPAGAAQHGLPFGVTFIAPAAHDVALLEFGQHWLGEAASPSPPLQAASTPTLPIAVVGAHLSGLPLNKQLLERGAHLRERTRTAARYRLFALPATQPPKPGMQRCAEGGAAIDVEVWDMPLTQLGSFLALVPSPLCLGSVELADGRFVHGFLCEAHALQSARDISPFGGWRAYLESI